MCELDQRYKAEHPEAATAQTAQPGLYDRIMPAPPNSEAQNLANNAARWAGQSGASLLNGEQYNQAAPHWYNLRAEQAMIAQAGWQFRSGFPQTGPVSIDAIRGVMAGASKGQSRFQEVSGPPRVGDVVASGESQNEINLRRTCGLRATLGVVEPDGVIKLNGGTVVKATRYFNQPGMDIRIFRPVP